MSDELARSTRAYLAAIGKAGGKAGTGKAKRRSASHYAKLGAIHRARYARQKADRAALTVPR